MRRDVKLTKYIEVADAFSQVFPTTARVLADRNADALDVAMFALQVTGGRFYRMSRKDRRTHDRKIAKLAASLPAAA